MSLKKNIPYTDDEINFFDFIFRIYSQKFLIIAITLTGLVGSSLFYFTSEIKYKGQLELISYSPIFSTEFKELNSVLEEIQNSNSFKQEEDKNKNLKINSDKDILRLNSRFFYMTFIEELMNKKILKNVILNKIKSSNNSNLKQDQLESIALNLAKDFKLEMDLSNSYNSLNTLTREINQLHFNLVFNSSDKKEIENIIRITLKKINQNILKKTTHYLEKIKKKHSININLHKIDLQKRISDIENRKFFILNKNIQFLKNQLRIAKKLNVDSNKIGTYKLYKETNDFIDLSKNLFFELNYFHNGENIISEQLMILEKKKKRKNFTDLKVFALQNRINYLNSNIFNNKVDSAIKNSPLSGKDFSAINFNINNIIYKDITKANQKVLIFTILSFILSILLSIVVTSYKNYVKEQ